MKAKKYIAYILIGITVFLNLIPLIPHHHHNNDITSICLLNDDSEELCTSEKPHTKTPFSNKNCPECCTTNITPYKASNPTLDFSQAELALASVFAILNYNLYDFTTPCYILKAKSIDISSFKYDSPTLLPYGLRAPPHILTFA